MSNPVEKLLECLNLETLERDLFRGVSPDLSWRRVYGGQVVAQALVAAQRTVEPERRVHSLHCHFLLGGDPMIPILYETDRIRDGGSFTTRRVVAIQKGEAIFSLSASFQREEEGFDHCLPMAEGIPAPEDLPSPEEMADQLAESLGESGKALVNMLNWLRRPRAFEMRPLNPTRYVSKQALEPNQKVWFRASSPLPADRFVQEAVLAYASDAPLLDTALFPHGTSIFDPKVQVASLDHAIWYHRPFDLSEWHLYSQDSPSASGARGFARGLIHSRKGELIASVAQEGLIRRRAPKRDRP